MPLKKKTDPVDAAVAVTSSAKFCVHRSKFSIVVSAMLPRC
jgi:hypothetical protein